MQGLRSAILSIFCAVCAAATAQAPASVSSAAADSTLLQGFENPPNGARPRVWWHWMNGNISEEGIKLDLDWMHRVGIAGVTIFEGAIDTPQVVPKRLIYMTPEWKHAFTYAVTTAKDLGMEVAIAGSPGWSETGGPWVPAPQGMKKMVWTATRVEGGKPFTGILPHPPEVDGTFQNFAVAPRRAPDGKTAPLPQFYQDAAVIAYRIPDDDVSQSELNPKVNTSGGGEPRALALSDGDVNTVAIKMAAEAPGAQSWVLFDYGRPQTVQAVTLDDRSQIDRIWKHPTDAIPPQLESSDDGVHFRKIAEIDFSAVIQRTVAFDPVTARYFRLVYQTASGARRSPDHLITELVLYSGARVNRFEERAGFAAPMDYYAITDPKVAPKLIVPQADVIDLSGKMRPDGSLDWTPPSGNWMVLRIGESLTGQENGPAPAEATGLEVDKLNRDFVRHYEPIRK